METVRLHFIYILCLINFFYFGILNSHHFFTFYSVKSPTTLIAGSPMTSDSEADVPPSPPNMTLADVLVRPQPVDHSQWTAKHAPWYHLPPALPSSTGSSPTTYHFPTLSPFKV